MKRMLSLAIAVALALACAKREAPASSPEGKPAGAPAEPGDAHDEGHETDSAKSRDVVRIHPSMLRDLRITTAAVETRSGAESAPVPGELRVPENAYAEVGSPVPARTIRVAVTAGQQVKRGQLLAELQSLELGKTRGEYGEARARVELAQKALDRKRGLAQERIAPLREVQEAEAELRSAEASLSSARASLQAMGAAGAEEGGASLQLRAPLSGTVIERNLAQGQVTEPSQTLFRIGSLGALWIVAHAPERDAVRVASGASARVSVPALPGEALNARVLVVGSQVETTSRTIPVRLELPNPGGALRPGMSATVWLPVGEGAPVLAVPAAALQRLGDKWCVFVPQAEGIFQIRVVGRGRDLGGEAEILSGLQSGETIVVEGAFLLKAEAEKARGEGAGHDH
jgi:cobalt-zinc-cadmium efflux system membrane fusion protein